MAAWAGNGRPRPLRGRRPRPLNARGKWRLNPTAKDPPIYLQMRDRRDHLHRVTPTPNSHLALTKLKWQKNYPLPKVVLPRFVQSRWLCNKLFRSHPVTEKLPRPPKSTNRGAFPRTAHFCSRISYRCDRRGYWRNPGNRVGVGDLGRSGEIEEDRYVEEWRDTWTGVWWFSG